MPMPSCLTRPTLPHILPTLEALRIAGVAVQMHAGGGSLKSQFKKADASGRALCPGFGVTNSPVARWPSNRCGRKAPTGQRPLLQVASWAADLLPA